MKIDDVLKAALIEETTEEVVVVCLTTEVSSVEERVGNPVEERGNLAVDNLREAVGDSKEAASRHESVGEG